MQIAKRRAKLSEPEVRRLVINLDFRLITCYGPRSSTIAPIQQLSNFARRVSFAFPRLPPVVFRIAVSEFNDGRNARDIWHACDVQFADSKIAEELNRVFILIDDLDIIDFDIILPFHFIKIL